MDRFRRLGLQRRIMLYVTVGLALLFGTVAFVGLAAIDEATRLVYQERLTTAHTTAGILERDFSRVATDVASIWAADLRASASEVAGDAAPELLDRLSTTDTSPFFRVSGIWLIDASGQVVDQAGSPQAVSPAEGRPLAVALDVSPDAMFAVLRALGSVPGAFAFAAVAVRVDEQAGVAAAIVHTVSVNGTSPYVPAFHGRSSSASSSPSAGTSEEYHLEVVDPLGIAVLGIGQDERPGQLSTHYPAIRDLMTSHKAVTIIHEPGPGETFERHVMAVVPLDQSPFYVVLEQPIDVALALPLQLRERLLVLTVVGFLAALAVAWVTTRHVVKPTEQLTAAAERMAQGDLASPIDVIAQDEVGKLAESLDVMRQRLQSALEATERTNRELEFRVAERTARLGQLLRKTITAQEEERHRLARELHDETAQTLAALSIAVDRARDGLGEATPRSREQIQVAKEITERLLAETRRLILGLRPMVLDEVGLLPAIRWQGESYLGELGVEVSVDGDPEADRLPGHIEVALFRIVQEAITNIARHAQARRVRISVVRDVDRVRVVVADDGKGFDPESVARGDGHDESVGLLGMQERVALLGGHLTIDSAHGRGTTLAIELPLVEETAA